MSKKILIMSATSEIAQGLAKWYLSRNTTLLLHGRNQAKLNQVAEKLRKVNPECEVVVLPLFDLINPHNERSDGEFPSLLDAYYAKWFDDLVMTHGLPRHMILAFGGTDDMNPSSVFELNAIAAMKCCEHFVRKVRENIHNDKYRNKKFRVVYMSSVAGERPNMGKDDPSSFAYSQSKWVMNNYLDTLRDSCADIGLHVHNSKVFCVDTELLRSGLKKSEERYMSGGWLKRMTFHFWKFVGDQSTVSVDYAAEEMKLCIDSNEETFWTPRFAHYIVLFFDGISWISKFILYGLVFSSIFVSSWRTALWNGVRRFMGM